ncbi:MAG: DUF1592 domain-containing protein [Acidobacteria bacterium]|nr:DUF1592 domain-containing protein [Acidobacteriota bacterium]MYJ05265.1 DUF1592 domain-containing protein [Acidobacteriota bacterium]
MTTRRRPVRWTAYFAFVLLGTLAAGTASAQGGGQDPETQQALLDRYCVTCHNDRLQTGNLSLEGVDVVNPETDPALWEAVLRKLRAGAMPPQPRPRPDAAGYAGLIGYLEGALDRAADASPDPGRTPTFRRLSRTDYQNAIRDLIDLDVDVTALLPRDDVTFGFDNVNAGGLSPTLMERYLAAAQKVSELAVGSRLPAPGSRVVIIPPDRTQERHVDGLPFGTRGGTIVDHTFPADGEYEIQVRLQRNRNENVEGLTEPHDMEITLDGVRLDLFTMHPSENMVMQANAAYYADVGIDNHLNVRLAVTAGPHEVGAAFIQKNSALMETTRQPYDAAFNMDRHPRQQPAVRSISIVGPFDATGVGETPSRDRIFACRPETADAAEAEECATSIIATLARRAYRRPVTVNDLDQLVSFYQEGYASDGFEAGVERALRALLASPEFLFRIERDPAGVDPETPYRVSDLELASRLSFFLWSSVPDEELLAAAETGQLSDRETLHAQVRRMLADPRAEMLTTNFAGQWLHLRNLDAVRPDARLFPDFDDNLRQGFRRETELLFQSVLQENRSVVDLLTADYTFVNERVARHYGFPGIYGDHFRRIDLPEGSPRAGLLGHGSILTVTSYATRTSPVLRGKWVLETLLGTPPPPPPPNVPPLDETRSNTRVVSMREKMAAHRQNPQCAVCHQIMDPAGLSMENFDAIGRWRDAEGGAPIDAAGSLPGGEDFDGVAGLRAALLERPELFASVAVEKLLTYALGRSVDPGDQPAVRAIVRSAEADGYRLSSLILGIVDSPAFQMRRAQS